MDSNSSFLLILSSTPFEEDSPNLDSEIYIGTKESVNAMFNKMIDDDNMQYQTMIVAEIKSRADYKLVVEKENE